MGKQDEKGAVSEADQGILTTQDVRGMGQGPLSHGPGGGPLQPPPPGVAVGGVPTSQGSQPAGHSQPPLHPYINGRANGSGGSPNGRDKGGLEGRTGLGLPHPRPSAAVADPIPVRMTGAGQGAQPGAGTGSRQMSGVVHVEPQYLAGWETSGMEQ